MRVYHEQTYLLAVAFWQDTLGNCTGGRTGSRVMGVRHLTQMQILRGPRTANYQDKYFNGMLFLINISAKNP